MGMARYLVEAHLLEGRPVAELAASHGVHRSWIYKLIARYRAEGDEGILPRSRRPRRSPSKTSQAFVAEMAAKRPLFRQERPPAADPQSVISGGAESGY
jgi:transposase